MSKVAGLRCDERAPNEQRPGDVIIPRRRPVQMGFVVVVVIATLAAVATLAGNKNMEWGTVGHYLFSSRILAGVGVTVLLLVIAMVLALLIGTIIALMFTSSSRPLRWVSRTYVWFFRGTPLIVQLVFWFNIGLLYPVLSFGIPFTDLNIGGVQTNQIMSGFLASILGLTLHEAAYLGEVIRSGISAVDTGQFEAADALGMPSRIMWRRVALPQVARVVIPPIGNRTIVTLQNTSLVSVISGGDLLTTAEDIYSATFEVIPLLIVASFWYLVLTSLSMAGQSQLEKRFGRGYER